MTTNSCNTSHITKTYNITFLKQPELPVFIYMDLQHAFLLKNFVSDLSP